MRKRFLALAIPVCGWMQPTIVLRAQDGDKVESKATAIIVQEKAGNTEALKAKVTEALEKAGVAADLREKVLKQLENSDAMSQKAKAKVDEALKNIQVRVGEKIYTQDDGKGMAVVVEGEDANSPLNQIFKARVVRNMVGQKYRIGVSCGIFESDGSDDKSESSQKGLLVNSVLPDSPAASAGIKEGDALVRVNDKELTSVEQLLEVVQEAGKASKELSIDLVRGDEKKTLKVKPAEIKDVDKVVEDIDWAMPRGGWVFNGTNEGFKTFQIPQIPGNGAFAFSAGNDDLKKEIEELRKEIKELKELVKELKK